MSRSDKNWKNNAIRVIEADTEVEEEWGIPLQEVLSVGTTFVQRGKSYQIKTLEECEGKWRTHVHINKSHCFDVRTRVLTKAE